MDSSACPRLTPGSMHHGGVVPYMTGDPSAHSHWPSGRSEMAARIRDFDWAATPLGATGTWSQKFKALVEFMLDSSAVTALLAGPDKIMLYNDGYARLIGPRHPRVLGMRVCEAFAEVRPLFEKHLEQVWAGRTVQLIDQHYPFDRGYGIEDAWFDVTYTPIWDAHGDVAGCFTHLVETTARVIAERARDHAQRALLENEERQAFLLRLSDALSSMGDATAIMETASRMLGEHLGADRAMYAEIEGEIGSRIGLIRAQHVRRGTPLPACVDYESKTRGWLSEQLRRGGRVSIADTATDPRLDEDARRAFLEAGTRALLAVSLVRNGQEAVNFGIQHTEPRAWTLTEAQLVCEVAERTWAAAERGRAERALRENEERQAFLLELSDALRPIADPVQVQAEAARLLGENMGAAWACYGEYDSASERIIVRTVYRRGEGPDLVGIHPAASFAILEKLAAGSTIMIEDTATSPDFSEASRARWGPLGMRSFVVVPIVKHGALLSALAVADTRPRDWSSDVPVLEETAQRTWAAVERGRAEAARLASEERFRQFANASSGALWIRDAATLALEYASPAMASIYGVEPGALLGDVRLWAGTIVPEDRASALQWLERARRGEPAAHEFRIQRVSDKAFRWIRSTEFALTDEQGGVQRVGGIAEDVTDTKLAVGHQTVLLAELQHRVRNIMAIIRSIVVRTGERAKSAQDYADLIAGRLLALARVQALLTRAANVSVDIRTIVLDEMTAQAQHEGQYVLEGPEVALAPKAAEILTLAVHELCTNALKYGALCVPQGHVKVRWSTFERDGASWLAFDWKEEGGPPPQPRCETPRRRGFGTELIEGRIPYELGGQARVVIERDGARCHLEFPLKPDASVLQTSAPQRAAVAGGALDMTGEADLSGFRILVVEDEYYLATDTARALQGAGAQVIGPCPSEEMARAEMRAQLPDAAVLDVNLGAGPSLKLAETLKDERIPFVFVTGYDPKMIPEEFSDIERLAKPVQLRHVVGAVAKLLAA